MKDVPNRELQFRRVWDLCTAPSCPQPVPQYRFHPVRKWTLDFAWPCESGGVAVEIQGGTFSRAKSGHTSGVGVQRDNEKSNAAILLGWWVLKYSSKDLDTRPVQVVEEIIEAIKLKRKAV